MDDDSQLQATTHVVAHLLRELEGSLADVLRPMVAPEDWPAPGSENAHQRRIDAISDALRVDADDDLRHAWRGWATGLAGLAHRHSLAAPRPVDAAFRDVWDQGQTVIFRLASRIESNFAATLPLIDELAAGPPDVGTLRHQVLHSTVALDRFFEQAGVAWLEPLREAGYFDDPPPLVYNDDGSVSYPRWPQGRYLARVAVQAADIVMTLGVGLETDNPEAHESFVDAACAVPAQEAARLVPTVERWLQTPAQWALPLKVRDLVVHLVLGGEVDAGLALLRTLATNPHVAQDDYLGGQLVEEASAEIFPAAGVGGLEVLADLLADRVAADSYGEHDYSGIWRPRLEHERRQDLRDRLVTAVRQASMALAGDPARLPEILAVLEAQPWSVFRRLALDVLATHPDVELIAARLTDHDLFADPAYDREYGALGREHFRQLSADAQATVFGWIEEAQGYEHDEDGRRGWQRHMLERLGRPLPGEWEARYLKLAAEAPEAPEPMPEVGFVGPRSPLASAELEPMSVEDIVALLEQWTPDNEWMSPSPAGLGRVLSDVVAEDPERFAAAALLFGDVDPTYVRAVFAGWRQAVKAGRVFPWQSVLELAYAVRDKPRDLEGRTALGDLDPGWLWTWQESLNLIAEGLEDGPSRIQPQHRELIWRVIEHHADDPNPALADENRDEASEPATQALNSVRGGAIRAALQYGWWLRTDAPDGEPRFPEELARLLDRHLDPNVERTAAIRSIYGQWFPYLIACDRQWAAEHVDAIFPTGDARLWRAAWDAYLRSNRAHADAYGLLDEQYRRGVDELEEPAPDEPLLGDVGGALVAHIMSFYAMGLIALDRPDGLLAHLYDVASVERRAEALDSLGRGLMEGEDLPEEVSARLRALWEQRLEAVQAGGDGEELRGYAWWFASGKFDAVWSLAQLEAMLQAGGRVHPDHLVAQRLAVLRHDHIGEVVRALELLIESGTRQWFVLGAREDIAAILTAALAAGGGPETRARDVINRLVARGHRDFENLLPS